MSCEYCNGVLTHSSSCPLYNPPKASHYCSICGEGIYNEEEYIVNDCGEYAHWECIDYRIELLEFLGYEIKTMGNGYEI